jgi:hypothetical protein
MAMLVDSVAFQRIEEAPAAFERWKMRVVLRGSEPEVRAVPLVVMVGALHLELLAPLFGAEGIEGIQGLLAGIPEIGDAVQVGYAGGPLLPTGFAFSETFDA